MTIQLIDFLSDGSIQLNDELFIPKSSASLFQAVFLNCHKHPDSGRLLDQVYLLSAAGYSLTKKDLAEIAQMEISEIEGLIERLSELLQVSLEDPEQGSGRIETENFRAFLVRNYAVEVALAEVRLFELLERRDGIYTVKVQFGETTVLSARP